MLQVALKSACMLIDSANARMLQLVAPELMHRVLMLKDCDEYLVLVRRQVLTKCLTVAPLVGVQMIGELCNN